VRVLSGGRRGCLGSQSLRDTWRQGSRAFRHRVDVDVHQVDDCYLLVVSEDDDAEVEAGASYPCAAGVYVKDVLEAGRADEA